MLILKGWQRAAIPSKIKPTDIIGRNLALNLNLHKTIIITINTDALIITGINLIHSLTIKIQNMLKIFYIFINIFFILYVSRYQY